MSSKLKQKAKMLVVCMWADMLHLATISKSRQSPAKERHTQRSKGPFQLVTLQGLAIVQRHDRSQKAVVYSER